MENTLSNSDPLGLGSDSLPGELGNNPTIGGPDPAAPPDAPDPPGTGSGPSLPPAGSPIGPAGSNPGYEGDWASYINDLVQGKIVEGLEDRASDTMYGLYGLYSSQVATYGYVFQGLSAALNYIYQQKEALWTNYTNSSGQASINVSGTYDLFQNKLPNLLQSIATNLKSLGPTGANFAKDLTGGSKSISSELQGLATQIKKRFSKFEGCRSNSYYWYG